MRNRALWAGLLSGWCAMAQGPASVTGVVVDSVTGAALPRVHVVLEGSETGGLKYGAMTTVEGQFSISGVAAGSYVVSEERVGFSMPAEDGSELVVRAGEKRDDLRLKMLPAGAISGRVTNADGEAVQGVVVVAESAGGRIASGTEAKTDSTGRFRIGGVTPGSYKVKTTPENSRAPAEVRTDGAVEMQDGVTYYPGVESYGQGGRVVVTAGGEASGADIRLTRYPVVAVSGRVEGAPEGAFNPQLWIAGDNGEGRSTGGVKPDGAFRLWRLHPGRYEIAAMWQGPGGQRFLSVPEVVEVAGSNVEGLALRVMPPVDVAGRVEFQEDAARPAGNEMARLTLEKIGIGGALVEVEVGADGAFHLSQVTAGRYRVRPSWRGVYVASMRMGTVAMEGWLLDLSHGVGGALTVRMSSATGALAGTVTDEKGPAVGAQVLLTAGDMGEPKMVKAGAGGRYSFEGLAPGKYAVVAVRQEAGQGFAVEAYEGLTEGVEIRAGEKVVRDLKRVAGE